MDAVRMKRRRTALILIPILMMGFYLISGVVGAALFPDSVVLGSFVGDIVTAVPCAALIWILRPEGSRDFGKPNMKGSAWLIILITYVVLWFLSQCMAVFLVNHIKDVGYENYKEVQRNEYWLYIWFSILVAPVLEEFLFRGVFYGFWKQVCKPLTACVLSSLIFAASHGTLMHLPLAFEVGVVSCLAYDLTGSLWTSVLLHMLYNLCAICFIVRVPTWCVSGWFILPAYFLLFTGTIVMYLLREQFIPLVRIFKHVELPDEMDDMDEPQPFDEDVSGGEPDSVVNDYGSEEPSAADATHGAGVSVFGSPVDDRIPEEIDLSAKVDTLGADDTDISVTGFEAPVENP